MIADAVERYLEQKGYERMALKAAMFDMDGVLFDSMKNHAKSWHETMAHFGLDLPEWEAYMHEGRTGGVVPMVVTGSGQKTLLERLNRNFPDIFKQELMVTAFDVKYGKPNPEPYLMGMEKYKKTLTPVMGEGRQCGEIAPNNFIVVENAPLGVQAGVAAGVFTIAVNTGPLPDEVLLNQGANLLFHSMQEFCEEWENVYEELTVDN